MDVIMDVIIPIDETVPLRSSTSAKMFFTCLTSGKVSTCTSNLNQHMKIYSDVKLYLCEVCQKTFGRGSNLQRHFKKTAPLQTVTGEKKMCIWPTCNQNFASTSNLNQRMKIHLGEKLHIYDICEKSFTRKSNLLRHLIKIVLPS